MSEKEEKYEKNMTLNIVMIHGKHSLLPMPFRGNDPISNIKTFQSNK